MTDLFLKPFNLDSMPAAFSSRRFCNEARRRESSICLSRALRFAFFPLVFARRALDRYITLLTGINQSKGANQLSQHYDLTVSYIVTLLRKAFPFHPRPYRWDRVWQAWSLEWGQFHLVEACGDPPHLHLEHSPGLDPSKTELRWKNCVHDGDYTKSLSQCSIHCPAVRPTIGAIVRHWFGMSFAKCRSFSSSSLFHSVFFMEGSSHSYLQT